MSSTDTIGIDGNKSEANDSEKCVVCFENASRYALDSESDQPWIGCNYCEKWFHRECLELLIGAENATICLNVDKWNCGMCDESDESDFEPNSEEMCELDSSGIHMDSSGIHMDSSIAESSSGDKIDIENKTGIIEAKNDPNDDTNELEETDDIDIGLSIDISDGENETNNNNNHLNWSDLDSMRTNRNRKLSDWSLPENCELESFETNNWEEIESNLVLNEMHMSNNISSKSNENEMNTNCVNDGLLESVKPAKKRRKMSIGLKANSNDCQTSLELELNIGTNQNKKDKNINKKTGKAKTDKLEIDDDSSECENENEQQNIETVALTNNNDDCHQTMLSTHGNESELEQTKLNFGDCDNNNNCNKLDNTVSQTLSDLLTCVRDSTNNNVRTLATSASVTTDQNVDESAMLLTSPALRPQYVHQMIVINASNAGMFPLRSQLCLMLGWVQTYFTSLISTNTVLSFLIIYIYVLL